MCYRCGEPAYEPWPTEPAAPGLFPGPPPDRGHSNMGPAPKGGLYGMFPRMADKDVQWVQGRPRDRGRAVGGFLDRHRETIRTTPQ